jgi:hypothetical protein
VSVLTDEQREALSPGKLRLAVSAVEGSSQGQGQGALPQLRPWSVSADLLGIRADRLRLQSGDVGVGGVFRLSAALVGEPLARARVRVGVGPLPDLRQPQAGTPPRGAGKAWVCWSAGGSGLQPRL